MSDRTDESPTIAMATAQARSAGGRPVPVLARWRLWLPTVIAFVVAAGLCHHTGATFEPWQANAWAVGIEDVARMARDKQLIADVTLIQVDAECLIGRELVKAKESGALRTGPASTRGTCRGSSSTAPSRSLSSTRPASPSASSPTSR